MSVGLEHKRKAALAVIAGWEILLGMLLVTGPALFLSVVILPADKRVELWPFVVLGAAAGLGHFLWRTEPLLERKRKA